MWLPRQPKSGSLFLFRTVDRKPKNRRDDLLGSVPVTNNRPRLRRRRVVSSPPPPQSTPCTNGAKSGGYINGQPVNGAVLQPSELLTATCK